MAKKPLTKIFVESVIDVNDFIRWVKARHKIIDVGELYDEMLDGDYIEGSLGSRWDTKWLTDKTRAEDERHSYDKYIVEFLKENKLPHVRFLYGG